MKCRTDFQNTFLKKVKIPHEYGPKSVNCGIYS